MTIDSIQEKTENGGANAAGRLTAAEFNCVVEQIRENRNQMNEIINDVITNVDIEELFK